MNPNREDERHNPSLDPELWRHVVNSLQANGNVHFQKILVATDFSPATQLALPYAVEMARQSGGKIFLVHVIAPGIYPMVPPEEWAKLEQEEAEFRKKEQDRLDRELQDIPHEFLFPSGDVWECLSQIIETEQIDLLVLGTRGRAGIRKAVFGSVAESVFRQATCPVLTVGPRVSFRESAYSVPNLNRILYATDFTPESLGAARYATHLAKEYRAGLVLLNSIQKAEPGQVNSAYETLRDVVPLGAGLLIKPKCTVERGAPAESILGASLRENADLIVLGIRSVKANAALATHFTNSITYRVVTQAECPVLTIRS